MLRVTLLFSEWVDVFSSRRVYGLRGENGKRMERERMERGWREDGERMKRG
jgi:hypothetical protein